eukprot:EG_transcript_3860
MGIKGLLAFLAEQRAVFRQAMPLAELIQEGKRTFVVDATSFLYMITMARHDPMDWLCGGQWNIQRQDIRRFLVACAEIGARLVFIFDTMNPEAKRWQAHLRGWGAALHTWIVAGLLPDVHTPDTEERLRSHCQRQLKLPEFLVDCGTAAVASFVGEFDIEVYESPVTVEGDTAVVAYCRAHHERIAAVLADDNDFLLLPHGCRLVRMNSIDWASLLKGRPLRAQQVVDTSPVPRFFGCETNVGLFAALVGCDYVQGYYTFPHRKAARRPLGANDPERFTAALAELRAWPRQVADPQPVVDQLAGLLQKKAEAEAWRKGAMHVIRFFSAPDPLPLVRYPGYQPVPTNYVVVRPVPLSDALRLKAGKDMLPLLRICAEYVKNCRADPQRIVHRRYMLHTAHRPPEETLHFRRGGEPPARFSSTDVVLPKAVAEVLPLDFLESATPEAVLCRILASPPDVLHAPGLSQPDRLMLLIVTCLANHRAIVSADVATLLCMYLLCQAEKYITHEEGLALGGRFVPAKHRRTAVYIGNLSASATSDQVRQACEAYGAVAWVGDVAPAGAFQCCVVACEEPIDVGRLIANLPAHSDELAAPGARLHACRSAGAESLAPTRRGVGLSARAQSVLHLAAAMAAALGVWPDFNAEPWQYFHGPTLQALDMHFWPVLTQFDEDGAVLARLRQLLAYWNAHLRRSNHEATLPKAPKRPTQRLDLSRLNSARATRRGVKAARCDPNEPPEAGKTNSGETGPAGTADAEATDAIGDAAAEDTATPRPRG